MAVIKEQINDSLVKHYSDKGFYLLQVETDTKYTEAIDAIPCGYAYAETDELIETDSVVDPVTKEKACAYDILVGNEVG